MTRIVGILLCVVVMLCCTSAYSSDLRIEIADYVAEYTDNGDDFVTAVMDIAYEEYGQDPWCWTFIAFYESRWKATVRGKAGERGWVQIHPCHRQRFKDHGLDWNDSEDQLRVGCIMVQERLDAGQSFWSAFSPWTTRKKAWKAYRNQLNLEPGSYNMTEDEQ